jgi:serine/threonine protein kinase
LGKLPAGESTRIASHVETCLECQRKVEGQEPDSFVGRLRAAAPRGTMAPPGGAPAEGQTAPPRRRAGADALADLPPELAASGKYDVLGKLGEGGMGAVWKARHAFLDCLVAIKVLGARATGSPEARARFLKEMRAAGRLQHRHIVRAYDAEQAGDLLLLVMEYVEGTTLDRLVRQKGPLPVWFACRCIAQAAEGLQHAHEKGLAHRDIKPGNIMVTKEKEVKVLDFGLARLPAGGAASTGLTHHEAFMGTPEYVAPEQAGDARSADIRSDVYSLGCTLYFLLSGRPPFPRATALDAILAHVQEQPEPLPGLRPEVPEALWAVVARMLAKRPQDRFQTPVEVAKALQPFLAKPPKAALADSGELAVTDPGTGRAPPPLPRQPAATRPGGTLSLPPPLPGGRRVPGRGAWRRRLPYAAACAAALTATALLTLLVLKLTTGGGKREPPAPEMPRPARDRDGFVSLLDGKDLRGWKVFPGQPNAWKVDAEGHLVGGGAPSYLFSERGDYENFHFLVEAKINAGGNSGQFFRANFAAHPGAYEAQINSNHPDPARTGSLYIGGWRDFVHKDAPPPDEWFTQEVIAADNHVVVKLNGKVTVDVWLYGGSAVHKQGHLAFQVLTPDTIVTFRRIGVKELSPADPAFVKDDWLRRFERDPRKFFENTSWAMGRSVNGNTSGIYPSITLAPNGPIRGARHPNESRWGVDGRGLVFRHKNGGVTSIFDKVTTRNGQRVVVGRWQGPGPRTIHYLVERP